MLSRFSTRSVASLVILFSLVGAAVFLSVKQENAVMAETRIRPGFDLQGHRGARGLMPENSLPGFEATLALGVTTLEMDTGMSRDGVIVVHHDRRIDADRTRLADGSWFEGPPPALNALSFAELQAFDLGRLRPGSKVAGRFPDQQGLDGVVMPSLEAVLARAEALSGGTIRYNIETKISPLSPEDSPDPTVMAKALVGLLEETGVVERAAVQSFDWRSLQAVQELNPTITTVYLTAEQDWLDNLQRGQDGTSPWTAGFDPDAFEGSIPRLIREAGHHAGVARAAGRTIWSPYFRDLRETDLWIAHKMSVQVIPWTVNDPDDMASLIELGVDGIITDYPDRLRAVMAERGMDLPPAFPSSQ